MHISKYSYDLLAHSPGILSDENASFLNFQWSFLGLM